MKFHPRGQKEKTIIVIAYTLRLITYVRSKYFPLTAESTDVSYPLYLGSIIIIVHSWMYIMYNHKP